MVKNLPPNAGDAGSTPGSGRLLGERNGNPLQCSCLGNFMERGASCATLHGVTKIWTRQQTRTHTSDPQDFLKCCPTLPVQSHCLCCAPLLRPCGLCDPDGLQPARLLCPWFLLLEYWSGLPCSPAGDLPNPAIESRFASLQAVSLPAKPPGKPTILPE